MLAELKLQPLPPIAHLDQYAGVWAINETHARQLIQTVNRVDLQLHVEQSQAKTAEAVSNFGFETVPSPTGNIAVVRLQGTLTKFGGSLSRDGSTLRARRALRNAVNDPAITAIMLHIDSPGGTVAGTKDLADDVAAAAQQKTIHAYIEDLGASAAYWIASQATKVYANATAVVGSIGTFMVMDDWSKAFEDAGVTVHVVRAGEFKGAGTMGTEITEEQLTEWQTRINQLNSFFTSGVRQARGLSRSEITELADGRVYIGKEAVAVKLIDGIQSLDKTLAGLSKSSKRPQATAGAEDQEPETMEPNNSTANTDNPTQPSTETPSAAAFDEIVACCKGLSLENGDDAKFVADCQRRKLTVEQAREEWMATLQARVESRDEELAQARDAATSKKPSAGIKPLKDGDTDSTGTDAGDPVAAWHDIVQSYLPNCGNDRKRAISRAVQEHEDEHQAYLDAYNEQHESPALARRRLMSGRK